MPDVILVDNQDRQVGVMEKLQAHQCGYLHRAFSIILWRRHGATEVLLQQRHPDKYHSGSLWSNSCCSHPQPQQSLLTAAQLRLTHELGITDQLKFDELGAFEYRHEFPNGMIEHEYDHVLAANYDGPIVLHPQEATDYQWCDLDQVIQDIHRQPAKYTVWLQSCLMRFANSVKHEAMHDD